MLDDTGNQLDLFDTEGDLTTTQRRAFERVVTLLNTMPLKYVIVEPNGTKHVQGDVDLVDAKPDKKSQRRYPHGALRDYVRGFVQDMDIGGVTVVPAGPYDVTTVQSSVGSYANYNWGKGSVVTARTKDRSGVEVLRIS